MVRLSPARVVFADPGARSSDPAISLLPMETDRARELLANERTRIEQALAALQQDGPLEGDARLEPGTRTPRTSTRTSSTRAGWRTSAASWPRSSAPRPGWTSTYGLSVESGEPIPDARLEARPLAERTVEEEPQMRVIPPASSKSSRARSRPRR